MEPVALKNSSLHIAEIAADYARAQKRILFLDYDGTLVPFNVKPQEARPSEAILKLLFKLSRDTANQVVIISGREKETLEDWLGMLPVVMVAEHGGFYKEDGQPWESWIEDEAAWKRKVLPFFHSLTLQFKGSFIEEKHFSIVWHYRSVVDEIHVHDKKRIFSALQSWTGNNEFSVYDEDCTLEFRTPGIDKGTFVKAYTKHRSADFVLALGDGKTDEDIFKALDAGSYSIKVGDSSDSSARFFLDKQENVVSFLTTLVNSSK